MQPKNSRTTPPPKLTELESRAWRGLLRAHRHLMVEMAAHLEADHQLDLSEYEVLLHLNEHPDNRIAMTELADLVLLTPSGVTRLVDRMVKRGLVERMPCPQDARRQHAVLTHAGRAMFVRAGRVHLAGIRALYLSKLTADEQEMLADVWDKVLGPYPWPIAMSP